MREGIYSRSLLPSMEPKRKTLGRSDHDFLGKECDSSHLDSSHLSTRLQVPWFRSLPTSLGQMVTRDWVVIFLVSVP